jgi:hypothetical protein
MCTFRAHIIHPTTVINETIEIGKWNLFIIDARPSVCFSPIRLWKSIQPKGHSRFYFLSSISFHLLSLLLFTVVYYCLLLLLNFIVYLLHQQTFCKYLTTIVIYITCAVGYILQQEVFRLKHDRAAGVF